MSNYIKATDFAVKDGLASGSPAKVIKGTEINTEFNAIQTAIATKAETNSPSFTGTPSAPTPASGDNTTTLSTTAFVQAAIRAMYPVGTLYINSSNGTNPASLFGFGTWHLFGVGRALVCINPANPIMAAPEQGFGSANAAVISHTHHVYDPGHTHTIREGAEYSTLELIPDGPITRLMGNSLDHSLVNATSAINARGYLNYSYAGVSIYHTGVDGTNANYQPSIAVYIWKRVA